MTWLAISGKDAGVRNLTNSKTPRCLFVALEEGSWTIMLLSGVKYIFPWNFQPLFRSLAGLPLNFMSFSNPEVIDTGRS